MSDLVITPIVCGAYQANAYLLYRSERPDALLIDPGDDYPALARAIAGSGKRLTVILLTHGHFDHFLCAARLRQEGLRARCVSLSVRSAELVTRSCQQTLPRATNLTGEIAQAAVLLFDGRFAGGFPYRSAGLSCSALTPDDAPVQLDFLGDEARHIKTERLESAIDGLRRRFGHQIVRRAVVLADGQYAQMNPREEHTVHPVPFYAG